MNQGADKAVRDAIAAFFAQLATDDALWTTVLTRMDATERARWRDRIRERLAASTINLTRLGYPRSEELWPVVAVTLDADGSSKDFAGRGGDYTQPGATMLEVFELVHEQQVGVTVAARDIDEARILSLLAFVAVLAARTYLAGQGYPMANYMGMQDLRPEDSYAPPDHFARHTSWAITEFVQVGVTATTSLVEGPVYCGIEGTDLGNGHTGAVEPVQNV